MANIKTYFLFREEGKHSSFIRIMLLPLMHVEKVIAQVFINKQMTTKCKYRKLAYSTFSTKSKNRIMIPSYTINNDSAKKEG